MNDYRVLVSAPYMLPFPNEFRSRLEAANVEIVTAAVKERLSEAELLPIIEAFDAVICGDDEFTERVLRRARRLRVISKWGTGIDSIDTQAARRLGIQVFNTPNAFTDAAADTAFGYVLCFARQIVRMNDDVRGNLWTKPQSVSLGECTLGIVGVGNIGKAVARRARAFGMQIIGSDIKPPDDSFVAETRIEMTSLPALLAKADYVTLHCDLNPTSFHLINQTALRLMKPSAYLVNTARGAVINETALVAALGESRIAGAALDVFEVEPLPADSPLRSFPNCLLAPHNANSSPLARQRVHESTVSNLLRGLRGVESSSAGDE